MTLKPTVKIRRTDGKRTAVVDGREIAFPDGEALVDTARAIDLVHRSPLEFEFTEAIAAHDPTSWSTARRALLWDARIVWNEGYGYVAAMMVEALDRIGVDVRVMPYPHDLSHSSRRLQEIAARPVDYTLWGVRHNFRHQGAHPPVDKRIRYTMRETTELPPGWTEEINRSSCMLAVPAEHQRTLFRDAGVAIPIIVVGHGVDQRVYHERQPLARDKFVFGTIGFMSRRKGIDVLIDAFVEEFPRERDVELIIKTHSRAIPTFPRTNPRIVIETRALDPLANAELLASFDVGVFPSRGEGFGLGGLEVMGVGRTIIATSWSGPTEYLRPELNYALGYELVDAAGWRSSQVPRAWTFPFTGLWAEPSRQHLRKLMRHCYEHRDEVRSRGAACAEWVRVHWSWERAARQLVDGLDAFVQGTGPLTPANLDPR